MYIFKPSIKKLLFNIIIGLSGLTTAYLLLHALWGYKLATIPILTIAVYYFYCYLYRDYLIIIIDNNKLTVKRHNKIVNEFNIKETEISVLEIDKKHKIQLMQVSQNNKTHRFDLELLTKDEYLLLKKIVGL